MFTRRDVYSALLARAIPINADVVLSLRQFHEHEWPVGRGAEHSLACVIHDDHLDIRHVFILRRGATREFQFERVAGSELLDCGGFVQPDAGLRIS
ncbi:hypothetical protein WL27_26285 [Burkholderia multivorans]|nr:hypothetical protein WL27_26285 [Burkholderia multivorans]